MRKKISLLCSVNYTQCWKEKLWNAIPSEIYTFVECSTAYVEKIADAMHAAL